LAQSVEVAELECLALGLRQRAQRDADRVGLNAAERFLVGALGRLLIAVGIELHVQVGATAPDGVDRAVAGDRQQPAAGAAALRPVAVAAPPEIDEGLLRHVLGG
jgi:hypothetical protein